MDAIRSCVPVARGMGMDESSSASPCCSCLTRASAYRDDVVSATTLEPPDWGNGLEEPECNSGEALRSACTDVGGCYECFWSCGPLAAALAGCAKVDCPLEACNLLEERVKIWKKFIGSPRWP